LGSEREVPHSPATQTPSDTSSPTAISTRELLGKLRERFKAERGGGGGIVQFRVPLEVYLAYKVLSPESKRALKEALSRTIGLASLGYINLEDSPTLVVRREVSTVAVEEVRRSELEERLGLCEEKLELLEERLELEHEKLRNCTEKLEIGRAKPPSPEVRELEERLSTTQAQLRRALELLKKSLDPRTRTYQNLWSAYVSEVTAFLSTTGAST